MFIQIKDTIINVNRIDSIYKIKQDHSDYEKGYRTIITVNGEEYYFTVKTEDIIREIKSKLEVIEVFS